MRSFTLSDFDFALPPDLIAQHPAAERSGSRLLDGTQAAPIDRVFRQFPSLLRDGDLVVFNDTRVVKARLFGEKSTGGKLELLIERVLQGRDVVAHMKVSKKPAIGSLLQMAGGFSALLTGRWPEQDGPLFRFTFSDDPYEVMARHGHVPLPPYIERPGGGGERPGGGAHAAPDSSEDELRYQTVFAKHPGAVAAPTAALHFDEGVLAQLAARGVQYCTVTLHVGAGTFQPVKTENIAEHRMHSERYAVPEPARKAIAETRQRGGRIVAVGTTTVRTLESWALSGEATGDTSIFITPGFKFRLTDLLLTNFHLPRSTLMMMISAFAGYDHVVALYRHAIEQRYRFFSYGDAMLLAKRDPC